MNIMVQWPSLLMCISSEIKVMSQRALCPQGEEKGRGGEQKPSEGQHHGVCLLHRL